MKGGGINPEFGCESGQENFWVEYAWISPSRFGVLGRPVYKPEFWDQHRHLEGDTLVIESINFDDSTWLERRGLFHSGSMRIVERLTRIGKELRYDMTIEDPEVFVEPWVMPTRVLPLMANADPVMAERADCEVYEEDNVTSQVRH